ncbi:MAG: DNA-3-methyladenine glycosylase [Candidatus Moranbacteria bacterium]|nr:DNA-3-methyladenine glycosylase [Candidatus Moranbacteria bacterium]
MPRLNQKFFHQETTKIARELLGKVLVRKSASGRGDKKLSGVIVETEAYTGPHDLACHASKGKTPRTQTMFESGGVWYVYMIYGMYHCLNIVTEGEEYPAAVLIRAIEPLEGIEEMKKNRKTEKLNNLTNGPGKLCDALGISKKQNCTSAISKDSELYIEDRGIKISPKNIKKAKRIGVDYAGIWKDKPLRFYIKDNDFVSKKD